MERDKNSVESAEAENLSKPVKGAYYFIQDENAGTQYDRASHSWGHPDALTRSTYGSYQEAWKDVPTAFSRLSEKEPQHLTIQECRFAGDKDYCASGSRDNWEWEVKEVESFEREASQGKQGKTPHSGAERRTDQVRAQAKEASAKKSMTKNAASRGLSR